MGELEQDLHWNCCSCKGSYNLPSRGKRVNLNFTRKILLFIGI
ncbi:hypothetical protein EV12_0257 [Prochlorococcus sp. MIT 0701]|nr:hypothetical protein EV12_0257 [Prochlorococcus sp. MIT 0701]